MANFVNELAETVSDIGAKAAYGETRDVNGTSIIPVALAYYGFGGGSEGEDDGANGGGAGGVAVPVGAYVEREGALRFEPNLIALLAVGIPFVWVAGRSLSRVIRALKR